MPLILLPNVLGAVKPANWLAPVVLEAVEQLDGLIAESERAGRRYLSQLPTKKSAREIPIAQLSKPLQPGEVAFLLEPVVAGEKWGLLSDAGLPCVADPGSELVAAAQREGILVQAYPGPSALFLALMLSGFSGQRFAFHGYLKRERNAHLCELEQRAQQEQAAQLFIEAPYRNEVAFAEMLTVLAPETPLCLAWNLTLPEERVITRTVAQWRAVAQPPIAKQPTVFLIGPTARVKQRHRRR